MKTKPVLRVLICDDLAIVRLAVHQVLKNTEEFQMVHEAVDGHDSIAKAAELKPDLVLMDVRMPDLDGAEATRQILREAPQTKVLAYSADSAWATVDRMLEAGVCGYVVKGDDMDEVVRAARTVLAGGHYLSLALLQPAECNN
jgi:DNA-binding NarL/FixJ family response regulator